MSRTHEDEDKQLHACGATSSYCPEFHKIPLDILVALGNADIPEAVLKAVLTPGFEQTPEAALIALGKRYKLGEEKHGKDNWKKGLLDKDYVIKRLDHVAYHAMKAAAKLRGTMPVDGDDDAGAIMWGGAFLCEALRVQAEEAAKPQIRSIAQMPDIPMNLNRTCNGELD